MQSSFVTVNMSFRRKFWRTRKSVEAKHNNNNKSKTKQYWFIESVSATLIHKQSSVFILQFRFLSVPVCNNEWKNLYHFGCDVIRVSCSLYAGVYGSIWRDHSDVLRSHRVSAANSHTDIFATSLWRRTSFVWMKHTLLCEASHFQSFHSHFWSFRTNATAEESRNALWNDAKAFGLFATCAAIVQFFMCLVSVDMVNYSARKQISRIRKKFLQSVLRQDMAWFETSAGGNFVTQLTEYVWLSLCVVITTAYRFWIYFF